MSLLLGAALTGWACGGDRGEQTPEAAAPAAQAGPPQRAGGGGGGGGNAPPKRVLRLIYAQYTDASKKPSVLVDDRTTLERYFDDELVDLLLADFACQKREGGACKLDRDPFVAAQDWKIQNLSMTRLSGRPEEAVLEVRFDNLGKETVIDYSLVKLERGWRIHDISYPPGGPDRPSLVTTLSAK